MTLVVRAMFRVVAYPGAVLAPLVFAAIGAVAAPSGQDALLQFHRQMRHVQMTRMLWLGVILIAVACLVFAAAEN